MKTLILSGVVASLIVAAVTSVYIADARQVRSVQDGSVVLRCHFGDGMRDVPADRVTGLMDGVWLFSNGHARNCAVIKGGDV